MASLKDIKRHIVAVKQTQKLTKAMNMVAAAKLRAVQGRTERFRYYADEHARLMEEVGRRAAEAVPSLALPSGGQKAMVVVLTSDRGLCGSFNANIFNHMIDSLQELRGRGLKPQLYVFGRKGVDYYNRYRSTPVYHAEAGTTSLFDFEQAIELTRELIDLYKSGDYAEVAVCYTAFKSLTRHVVTFEPLLPLSPEAHGKTGKEGPVVPLSALQDYIIEPKPAELVNRLVPRSLAILLYRAMLESITSENAARMQAMDNASNSCKDIITSLTMAYNKARQAAVTNELLDIVNGAEALKG
ncbi:MAG: ATP synthase F1 subunit gamma [Deltaproteobacteria bacterium]|jgi:F-type H+-transporting ATPase subunit gamma|nr:ATP synthase F1 subunit gamma [Deltaproteobacteria bacterium]